MYYIITLIKFIKLFLSILLIKAHCQMRDYNRKYSIIILLLHYRVFLRTIHIRGSKRFGTVRRKIVYL